MGNLKLAPSNANATASIDAVAWRDGGPFTPAGGNCPEQPSLERVSVVMTADGWRVTLTELDAELSVPLENSWGIGRWNGETAPVFASGGWYDADTLRVEVIFVETPHRLIIDCELPGRTFTASWITPPRGSTLLRALSAPRTISAASSDRA